MCLYQGQQLLLRSAESKIPLPQLPSATCICEFCTAESINHRPEIFLEGTAAMVGQLRGVTALGGGQGVGEGVSVPDTHQATQYCLSLQHQGI